MGAGVATVKSILLREFGMGDSTKGEALWIRAQRARDSQLLGDADKASKAFTKKRLRAKPQEASQALFAARKVLDATSGGLKRHLEKLSVSSERSSPSGGPTRIPWRRRVLRATSSVSATAIWTTFC